MTREEAIEKIKRWKLEIDDEKDYADYLEGWFYKDDEIAFDMAIEALEERKEGKWIPHPGYREWDVCSACGIGCKRREYGEQDGHEWMTEHSYQFCPWCGAKMEV